MLIKLQKIKTKKWSIYDHQWETGMTGVWGGVAALGTGI